jgi:hypothetical protein
MEAKLHIFLTSTLDGGNGSNSVPGKQQLYPLTGGLVGSTTDLDVSEKGKIKKVLFPTLKGEVNLQCRHETILV